MFLSNNIKHISILGAQTYHDYSGSEWAAGNGSRKSLHFRDTF